MAQLFHPSSNTIAKLSIVGTALGVPGLIGVGYAVNMTYGYQVYKPIEQPVQFSHKHHVLDDGIDCRYCHQTVETTATAGMPPTQTCMNCHSQIWADSPYLEPVRASFRDNKPIEWQRVHDLPEYTYFNHSIHISKGVGCSTCHGQVDNMPAIFQENTLQMEWCIACHRAPENFIRPKSEIFNMQWQDSDINSDERKQLKAEYKIRDVQMMTSCSTCHR